MMRATTVGLLALFCVAAVGCAAMKEEKAMANAPTANVVARGRDTRPGRVRRARHPDAGPDRNRRDGQCQRRRASGPLGAGQGRRSGELLKLSLATATFSQLEVKGDTMTGMTPAGQLILRRSK